MLQDIEIWLRLRREEFRFYVDKLVRRYLRKVIELVITDLDLMNSFHEIGSSAAFERAHLQDAASFKGRHQLYRYVLSQIADDSGLFMEFGVYRGDSINRLAELRPDVRWYGFDSFEGLPEHWAMGARQGTFTLHGKLPAVRPNVVLTKGLFADTLPDFVARHSKDKVAFIHIDCDLYSATKSVFDEFGDMLQPGCIIVFDEYFNYRGWQDCEFKAFSEYIARTGHAFEYIGYVRTGGQVAVRLLAAPQLASAAS